MKNEICVPAQALGIGGSGGGGAGGGGMGAPGGDMVTPDSGDEVEFSGKGRVTRVENGNAYIEATEINGQPVMQAEGMDEGAMLDAEMAGLAGDGMGGGGAGGFGAALGLLLLCLLAVGASGKEDLAWAGVHTFSGGQVSNYVAVARNTQVYSVEIDNHSGATLYLLIFDSATNSLNGRAVEFTAVPVPTGSLGYKEFNAAGAPCYYGVNVCLSTTPYSLTNASAGGAVTVIHSGGAR